jgi:hypothetical protein
LPAPCLWDLRGLSVLWKGRADLSLGLIIIRLADLGKAGLDGDQLAQPSRKPTACTPIRPLTTSTPSGATFPLLPGRPDGRPLAYLDNAASAQKPRQVLDALHGPLHPGLTRTSTGACTPHQRATDAYDDARERVRAFLNAREAAECVFTAGSTEGVNLVAFPTHARA